MISLVEVKHQALTNIYPTFSLKGKLYAQYKYKVVGLVHISSATRHFVLTMSLDTKVKIFQYDFYLCVGGRLDIVMCYPI